MAVPRVFCVASLAALVTIAALILAPAGGPWTRVSAQATEPRVVDVTASRFAFEPATIDAVVGERLRLVMTSADGVHGLEIKKFRVKKEIPRGGTPVAVEFTADTAGRFPILCSEYCGDGHEEMTGTLIVRVSEDGAP